MAIVFLIPLFLNFKGPFACILQVVQVDFSKLKSFATSH